jgi:ATP-binding cassette, subfamily C, bacterial LapB
MSGLIQLPTLPGLPEALEILSARFGGTAKAAGIAHGMPLENGKLSAVHIGDAAERAGLDLAAVALAKAAPSQCPLLLSHPDGRALVMAEIKPGGLGIAVTGDGADASVLISTLETAGFAACWTVRPRETRDRRTAQTRAGAKGHWIIDSLWMKSDILGSVFIATLFINVLALAIPLITMNVLDRVVSHAAFETLWALALGGLAAVILDFVLRSLRGLLIDRSSARSDVAVSNKIFAKVLGTRTSARQNSVGVQSNSLREFESLREICNAATVTAIGDLPFAVLFLVVIYLVAGPLVLVPIAAIPLLLLCGAATQSRLHKLVAEHYKDSAHKNTVAIEVLANMETVKSHAAESWAASKWERAVASHLRHSIGMRWYSALSANLILALQGLTTIAILVFGVYLISAGQISPGALFATTMLTGRALTPIAQIAGLLSKMHHAKTAYAAITRLVDAEQERPPEAFFISGPARFGSLVLDRVDLAYSANGSPVLKNVSLKINAGERVGIIGGIGSGKSSLLRVLIGLRQPTRGSVAVDGVPVRQVDPAIYRKKFGTAFREEGFFFGTVRENLCFHRPGSSDGQLVEAARIGGALPWINTLPAGFDTVIGESGQGLSSGQRQTLALSRAILGDPEILLLDEPTSDLDGRTEAAFVQRLKQLPPQSTLIVVTHRPSVIDACSRLVVIESGGILMDADKALVLARLKQMVNAERGGEAA